VYCRTTDFHEGSWLQPVAHRNHCMVLVAGYDLYMRSLADKE